MVRGEGNEFCALEQEDRRLNCPSLLLSAWALFANEVKQTLPICVYSDNFGKGAHYIASFHSLVLST